ncbi:PTS sugar transporter subunit IIA [Thiomonas bhubaneswarensis]|uniref:Phosphotransferase system, mannose/fructose-specific component IIA n=1 Tax=Thiomonas bhubaneswarensis TaxID=339866 RepID=A0A0K6HV68_9BURK|nr:PTS fructose transporter subunit IIA [Thiomonas bhubaneswarensis]CUA94809.1 Phosphotransferase system, mannose/fructose-specific component IIA [Thiomonas bhubaneswarensis]
MPGLFIVAHAPLASALRECASHVYAGCPQRLLAFDVAPDAPVEAAAQDALVGLRQAASDGSALLLVDVFGATPSNIAQRLTELASDLKLKIVAGVNLPMLLRSVCYQNESLEALAARATAGAIQGVIQISASAPQQQPLRSPSHAATHHSSQQ